MRSSREATTTIADFNESATTEVPEPRTQVRAKKLSGGVTMWQARLVLSTLDPKSTWASKLRSAIRAGDGMLADALLDAIYARNSTPPERMQSEPAPSSSPSGTHSTTVLPPSPGAGRIAS